MSSLKRITSFLILLCVATALAVTAVAAPVDGSIRLHLTCGGEPVPGGTLTLYRAGEPGEGNYVLSSDFRGSGADLTKLSDPGTARTLADYARQRNIPGQTLEVDASGSVCFAPLDLGLYLIVQSDAAGGYEPIRPFLVTIPLTVGGDAWYDVDASPKVALTPESSEEPGSTDPLPPQTGQPNWPVPALAAGMLLAAGGLLCLSKRKNHEA